VGIGFKVASFVRRNEYHVPPFGRGVERLYPEMRATIAAMSRSTATTARFCFRALVGSALCVAAGCESGMVAVDRDVAALLNESTQELGGSAVSPRLFASGERPAGDELASDRPGTRNPAATDLQMRAIPVEGFIDEEADRVVARLDAYATTGTDASLLDLPASLSTACAQSREYRFAEEDYVLAGLRLLTEEHRWGPRFFDEISADVSADADDGLYDSSLSIVNELGVTQRLPYGGEVSARALARAVEDLHQRVTGEGVQSAELILSADVPLLRGAGLAARESLIQTRRDLIYAARDFEDFRRGFLLDVVTDYLDLTVALRRIENAQRGVASFERLQAQQEAIYMAGRSTPFDAAEAKNATLEAIDRLNSVRESYRLALDRFKARIGLPIDRDISIQPDALGLTVPQVTMDDAVRFALAYRLDLQTSRDQLADAWRAVDNADNELLPDLTLSASASMPTDPDRERAGVRFDREETDYRAGLTFSIPLDRRIERLSKRQAQIRAERAERSYDQARDNAVISVRGAVRGIDAALFALRIQERNLEIALNREASIKADPARATLRQQSDAIDQVLRARDSLDEAKRDVELAVLRLLLETGQLRVDSKGYVMLPKGMSAARAAVSPEPDEPATAPVGEPVP